MEEYYFYTEGLTVGYHGVPLIKNIKISLKKGEILTLIGPNGAGKTTILRSIIKQLKPLGGVVVLDGKETEQISGKELSRKLSVVLTERVRPEMMTCKEVVATGRYPYTGKFGVLSKEDWKLVDEAMELVHIHELADRDFSKTSDGQKQRVMLARAICQQPDIIILDEPTSFLDIRYKLEFLSIIQNMSRERNLSVIMSLHELDLAGRISDKIACVRGDIVDRFGTPDEIYNHPKSRYVAAFVGYANILKGIVAEKNGHHIKVKLGDEVASIDTEEKVNVGENVTVALRGEHILLEENGDLHATVKEKNFAAGQLRVLLTLPNGDEVTASRFGMNADIQPGQQICWRFEPKDAVLVDRPKGGTN